MVGPGLGDLVGLLFGRRLRDLMSHVVHRKSRWVEAAMAGAFAGAAGGEIIGRGKDQKDIEVFRA